jgi:hypothetical protein
MYTQPEWLLSTLLEFYQNKDYLDILKRIINREYLVNNKKLSIRIVNWFVTNYAKQHFTFYEIPSSLEKETTKRFFVWTSYKSTEDSFSKQMFDPYCRQERILIPYDDTNRIETTIGQLHFFKWAILNKVLDYIVEHFEAIEKDMSVRLNTLKKKSLITDGSENDASGGKTRKKREELSLNACRSMRKELGTVQIKF